MAFKIPIDGRGYGVGPTFKGYSGVHFIKKGCPWLKSHARLRGNDSTVLENITN